MKEKIIVGIILWCSFTTISIAQTASSVQVLDSRDNNTGPNGYSRELKVEFKWRNALGVPGTGSFGGLMTIAPWTADGTGNNHHQLFFEDEGIYWRTGYPNGTAWNGWNKIWHSGNFNPLNYMSKTLASISESGSIDNFKTGYTFAYIASGSPWHGPLLSFGGLNDDYNCQINASYNAAGKHLSFRTRNGDNGIWNGWNEIWHSGNFDPANYTPKQSFSLTSEDTRSTNLMPQERNCGVYFDFKYNQTDGLNDANIYHGVMTLRPYGGNADFSGGLAHQLAFTDNGNMWLRSGANTTWSGWSKIYSEKNLNRQDVDFNAQNIYANGNIWAKEIKVALTNPWADFVFSPSYNLRPLSEVEKFVQTNGHLPEIPSASEVKENGMNMGEMQNKLLQKVEELTLYVIEQQKKIDLQGAQLNQQTAEIKSQRLEIERLKTRENRIIVFLEVEIFPGKDFYSIDLCRIIKK